MKAYLVKTFRINKKNIYERAYSSYKHHKINHTLLMYILVKNQRIFRTGGSLYCMMNEISLWENYHWNQRTFHLCNNRLVYLIFSKLEHQPLFFYFYLTKEDGFKQPRNFNVTKYVQFRYQFEFSNCWTSLLSLSPRVDDIYNITASSA